MVVVGGMDFTADGDNDNSWETTDKLIRGLGVFSVNELKWKDRYDPKAADYDTPEMVAGWYKDGYGLRTPSDDSELG